MVCCAMLCVNKRQTATNVQNQGALCAGQLQTITVTLLWFIEDLNSNDSEWKTTLVALL